VIINKHMKKKKIHFVGIKGVGMTPLAIMAKQAGFVVSGSDTSNIYITDAALKKSGITPIIGFSPEHIKGADLVIATGAHGGYDNSEVSAAKEKGIQVLTQGEAVGYFMSGVLFDRSDMKGISVAGCHGKTTTTAMIATLLTKSGFDPSYVIGTSEISPLGLPGHFGLGEYFVAEADEYATEPQYNKAAKFLWQYPEIAVFTNIEWDHPDIYASVNEVTDVFIKFTKNITPHGLLVLNGDDAQLQKVKKNYSGRCVMFGKDEGNDYQIKDIRIENGITSFSLFKKGKIEKLFQNFSILVAGEHNVFNAAAAVVICLELSIPLTTIQKSLLSFKGTKRRTELLGMTKYGSFVYDDYAHHPTEIKKTLEAIRGKYPDKKIVCIFQPHTYSRTKKMLDQFSTSFLNTDMILVSDIYPSEREKPDPEISSKMLVSEIRKHTKNVKYSKNKTDIIAYLEKMKYNTNYLIVLMGAGDIYEIGEQIIV